MMLFPLFLLAKKSKKVNSQAINIGTGKETTLIGLLKSISEISKKEISPEFMPARKGDIIRSVADIKKARTLLGFEPKFGLRQGLASFI